MKTAAPVLRQIARLVEDFERHAHPDINPANEIFTCHVVDDRLGRGARATYEDIFGLADVCSANSTNLWGQPDVHQIRILMLGFAAAMAETGDFH